MLWVRILIRARCATLCDKVCQWLATGQWFSPGTPVSSNKTDCHDITEILLKVVLNTIKQTTSNRGDHGIYKINSPVCVWHKKNITTNEMKMIKKPRCAFSGPTCKYHLLQCMSQTEVSTGQCWLSCLDHLIIGLR